MESFLALVLFLFQGLGFFKLYCLETKTKTQERKLEGKRRNNHNKTKQILYPRTYALVPIISINYSLPGTDPPHDLPFLYILKSISAT
jgi:hypothetical protein